MWVNIAITLLALNGVAIAYFGVGAYLLRNQNEEGDHDPQWIWA